MPIELHTDASKVGIGAMLIQRVNGEIHYLGFRSRVLNKAELNYSIPKKDLISIIEHIKYFEYILRGITFQLYTDSRVIKETMDALKDPRRPLVFCLDGFPQLPISTSKFIIFLVRTIFFLICYHV